MKKVKPFLATAKVEGAQVKFDEGTASTCSPANSEQKNWYERSFTSKEYEILAAALKGDQPIVKSVRKDFKDMAKGLLI